MVGSVAVRLGKTLLRCMRNAVSCCPQSCHYSGKNENASDSWDQTHSLHEKRSSAVTYGPFSPSPHFSSPASPSTMHSCQSSFSWLMWTQDLDNSCWQGVVKQKKILSENRELRSEERKWWLSDLDPCWPGDMLSLKQRSLQFGKVVYHDG